MLGNCGVISIIVSLDAKLDYVEISVIVCVENECNMWMQYPDNILANNRFVFGLRCKHKIFWVFPGVSVEFWNTNCRKFANGATVWYFDSTFERIKNDRKVDFPLRRLVVLHSLYLITLSWLILCYEYCILYNFHCHCFDWSIF